MFYSLCNFATDLRMTPEHAARPSFKEIQKLGENWEPDFDSLYNFPPASRLSMIARLVIRDGRMPRSRLSAGVTSTAMPCRGVVTAARRALHRGARLPARGHARGRPQWPLRSRWRPSCVIKPAHEARRPHAARMDRGAVLHQLHPEHHPDAPGHQRRASGARPAAHGPGDPARVADRQPGAHLSVHLAFGLASRRAWRATSAAARLPVPTRYTVLSGIGTALVLFTVPLSFTFTDVSIPFIQLLMRGDILRHRAAGGFHVRPARALVQLDGAGHRRRRAHLRGAPARRLPPAATGHRHGGALHHRLFPAAGRDDAHRQAGDAGERARLFRRGKAHRAADVRGGARRVVSCRPRHPGR